MSGELFIVATPIGNLSDISARTAKALADAEIVLAEDTRVTQKLLHHLNLKKTLLSCHDFNESKRASAIEDYAQRQLKIALVSDAGTPLVSDPGYRIVQEAINQGMTIVPIAGPSAFLLALVGSGLPCSRFLFEGFLPERPGDRRKKLNQLKEESATMIFYFSVHDQLRILNEIWQAFGNRQACIARELTKLHEEFLRGSLESLIVKVQNEKLRGECVLVVAGQQPQERERSSEKVVRGELSLCLAQGQRLKDAATQLAKKHGWTRSQVYRLGIDEELS